MEYITKVLGVSVSRSPIKSDNTDYFFERVRLDNLECIFLKPKGPLSTINQIKEQLKIISKAHKLPVVLEIEALSRQRADSFIKAKIPFVVLNRQIYLPFLATYISENYSLEKTPLKSIFPSAQLILFNFIYNKNRPLPINGLSERLGFSQMSISRGASQLINLGLLNEEKDGTLRILTSTYSPKALFEKAMPYLINPIRTTVYVDKKNLPDDIFLSGFSANNCFGTLANVKDIPSLPVLIDSDRQCTLEIWRYNPFILGEDNKCDILSLYMAYEDNPKIKNKLERLWGIKKTVKEKTQKLPEKQPEQTRFDIPSYLL